MNSGVEIAKEVSTYYNAMKMSKSKAVCMALKIHDKKEIVVDEDYAGVTEWQALLEMLPPNDARYIVFLYKYRPENRDVDCDKLIFMFWCPEEVSVNTKMLYASSKDTVKKIFGQELPTFQADCREDVDDKTILDKLKKF